MNVFKSRSKSKPRRRWEDRQLLGGYDPRALMELQAIVDRAQSDMAVGAALGRSAQGARSRGR